MTSSQRCPNVTLMGSPAVQLIGRYGTGFPGCEWETGPTYVCIPSNSFPHRGRLGWKGARLTTTTYKNEPRHLRRIWDLGPRVFDKANPNLLCIFLFGNYLESYFKKEINNQSRRNMHGRSGFFSSRAFRMWSRIFCSPSGLFGNWFYCVHLLGVESSCT